MNQLEKILSKVGDLNFRRRIIKVLDYLEIKPDDIVLDAGCGEGFYSMLFSHLYNCPIKAIDSDKDILSKAEIWLKGIPNVSLSREDLNNLSFKNDYFDKVVCSEVLEHIPEHEKAIKEIHRVTKKGGILAVTVPNNNYPFLWDPLNKIREFLGLGHFNPKSEVFGGIWAYDHKRLYSVEQIRDLIEKAGFRIVKIEVLTHYGVPFNHLILVLGKRFYTKLPVPNSVKNSMEKFKWENEDEERNSVLAILIKTVLEIFKKVDKLNDRKFDPQTSTMTISLKAEKI